MECGVWSVGCEVWSVKCGVWSVQCRAAYSVKCAGLRVKVWSVE